MRSSPPYRLHLSDPPEHPSRYPSARSVHHSADGRKESARRKRTCLSGLPAQRNNHLSRIQKQSGRTGKDKAQYRPDKNDTNVVISHIDIHGYASPEGPYSNNERLARERTRTLKDYVCSQYAFNDTLFTTHYTPEDWDGFVKLLTDTVITHREELLHIAESKSSPDGKERKIRKRYPEEFRFILQHWFPGLRHSDYTIHYVVRPFTVEQAKQVFQSNPKNLSIEEMFRIARTYPADSPEYNKIFMTAVLLNPEHPVANLNAACILLSQGDTKGASLYLDKAGETPEKTLLQGIMQMLNGNYTEAENLLHKAEEAGLPQAGENLKILHEIY